MYIFNLHRISPFDGIGHEAVLVLTCFADINGAKFLSIEGILIRTNLTRAILKDFKTYPLVTLPASFFNNRIGGLFHGSLLKHGP